MAQATNPDQSLLETLRQVKLNLDLAIAGVAGGQEAAQAIDLLQRRFMQDTNSGCNTSCCGGGGSGCLGALGQPGAVSQPEVDRT